MEYWNNGTTANSKAGKPVHFGLLVCTMFLLASCSTRLVGDIEEMEANRIVGVLEEEGIWAAKEKEVKGRNVTWVVVVASEDSSAARKILQVVGLPKEKKPGMARLLESGGIIPTAEEQKKKEAAALGEELSRTIETLTGVVEAHVLISLPVPSRFPGIEGNERVESTASVLIRHRVKPSFSLDDVRSLVAGAVAGMKPENVIVVFNRAEKKPAAVKPSPYRKVGPFLVAPSSRNILLGFIIALLGCNLTLAAIVIAGAVRFFRRRKQENKT